MSIKLEIFKAVTDPETVSFLNDYSCNALRLGVCVATAHHTRSTCALSDVPSVVIADNAETRQALRGFGPSEIVGNYRIDVIEGNSGDVNIRHNRGDIIALNPISVARRAVATMDIGEERFKEMSEPRIAGELLEQEAIEMMCRLMIGDMPREMPSSVMPDAIRVADMIWNNY